MSKNTHALTVADFADILSSTLAIASEVGLIVGVRDAAANEKRPDGLMIYVAGLRMNGEGSIVARTAEMVTEQEVTQ